MKAFINHSKFFSKFLLLTIILISFATTAFSQVKTKFAEQRALISEFEVNGLKVLVKKRSNAPTVAVRLFIKGGARNINEKNAGIESLSLDAAVEGSKNFPRKAIRQKIAATGSGIGASVSNDYSVITFGSTRQSFDEVWKVFSDIVMNPTFEKDDVERVRKLKMTALREAETDNDNFLEVLQEKVVYANHPYSNKVSGTLDTMAKFTPMDLRKHYRKIMQTSQLLLVVVGDIEAENLRKKIESTIGKLPKGNYSEKSLPEFDFTKGTLDITSRKLPTNYIRGIFDAPSINEADYYAMRVAVTILRNRLFREVRERRQLSYAPNAGLDTYSANTGNIYVTAVDANTTMKIMLDQIKRLRNQPVNEFEIKGVVGGFLTNYYLDQETNAAQAAELAKYELIGGGWRNSLELLNRLREVTPTDVQTVSRNYMKNIRFVVIGNPIAIDKEIFLQDLD